MNFHQALRAIESARQILLTTHVRPDGDAVGALVALQSCLKNAAQKKQKPCTAQLLFLSSVPDHYQFLLPAEPWTVHNQLNPQPIDSHTLDQYDLIIVVDTSADRQLPGLGEYLKNHPSRVLVIDHHLAHDGLGAIKLIDTHAAAAGEIVYNLICTAGWTIDPDTATALFVALSTDTGWFRFENVTDQTYHIAAQLVAAGAQPHQIYRTLFQQFPASRLKLMTQMLQTLELFCNDRLAVMHITTDMINQTGAQRTQIENMVNEAQQIGSVEVTVLLVEQKDRSTRVSFRSRGHLDVNHIAQKFSGGGHANAAGATLNLPLNDARSQIINTLTHAMS